MYIRKLTFTSTSIEKIYDGEPLLPDGKYSWEGTLESGHKLEGVEFLREQLTVGKVANSFNVKLVDENGEALYSENSPEDEAWLLAECRRRGLGITGGSDYHGSRKPWIELGRGRGKLRVPYTLLEELKKA